MAYGCGFGIRNPEGIPGFLRIIGVYRDRFVSYFTPTGIMHKSYQIFPVYKNHPQFHQELIDIAEKTKITDNPVLIFFDIKIEN